MKLCNRIQRNLFHFHYFLLRFARIAVVMPNGAWIVHILSREKLVPKSFHISSTCYTYDENCLASFFFYGCQDQFARLHCCYSLFFFPSFPLPNTWRKRYYCDPILVPYIRYYFLDTKSRLDLLMLKFELVEWFNFHTKLAGFSER